jgi:PAS domain S-box-containing protein
MENSSPQENAAGTGNPGYAEPEDGETNTGRKKPDKRAMNIPGMKHSLREEAEEKFAQSIQTFPGLEGQTAEELIHELQVHQIELEMQAEELNRVQFALEISRDKYLDLYDFAPLGYLTLNNKAMIEEVNLTGSTLLGVERSKLMYTRFRKFIAPEYFDAWDRYFLNVLNQGKKQSCPLMIKRGDGSTFPARLECTRTIDRDEKMPMVRMAISDISHIRISEMALRISNKKLTLLSGITRHDINNQLTVVKGYLGMLEAEQHDPTLTGYCKKALNASEQITAMIQFTKDYEEIGITTPAWQDCHALVELAATQAPLGQVIVKNDLPDGMEVFADPLIVKVFYNLMDNAVRYGEKITTIRFSVKESKDSLTLTGEDDGNGVPAEEKERIFDRGFGKNTGFGLTLAREILDITDITIHETGEPGKGARFEMTVPNGAYRRVNGTPQLSPDIDA